jgi:hypothetical protein
MAGHLHYITLSNRTAACGKLDPFRVNAQTFRRVGSMLPVK